MEKTISGMFIYQRLLQAVEEISDSKESSKAIMATFDYDIFICAKALLMEGYLNQEQLDLIDKAATLKDDWVEFKKSIIELKKIL